MLTSERRDTEQFWIFQNKVLHNKTTVRILSSDKETLTF